MGDELLNKIEETVGKLQISTLMISKLQNSTHPGVVTKTLEKHEQNWRDLVAQQRKYLDKSKSDRQTTKTERDKALADRKTTKEERDKAREDRNEAAKLLDQARTDTVSLEMFPLTHLQMGISDHTFTT